MFCKQNLTEIYDIANKELIPETHRDHVNEGLIRPLERKVSLTKLVLQHSNGEKCIVSVDGILWRPYAPPWRKQRKRAVRELFIVKTALHL